MKKHQLAFTVLDRALTTKRPHGDQSTAKFCTWLTKLLPPDLTWIDACGNIHVDQRSGKSKSLFVAHVDTVHRKGGKNKVIKTDKMWSASGAPLGADDGAGIAMLVHMIRSGVMGYYIFTQGEEVGGIGSKWIADNMPGLLMQFDRAIAFDRRCTYSVITHQGFGGRCASNEFGDALSMALCDRDMLFMPDDTGVYTDTAEFVDYIPECTNISVGYDMEHSERETLDITHFTQLLRAVPKIDWEALPVVRDPLAVDPDELAAYPASWYGKKSDIGIKRLDDDIWMDTSWKADVDEASFAWSDAKGYEPRAAIYDLTLIEAIGSAFDGDRNELVKLIAAAVSPASPRSAEKQIPRRLITQEFLAGLLLDAKTMDTDTLLMTAFDEIGVGV